MSLSLQSLPRPNPEYRRAGGSRPRNRRAPDLPGRQGPPGRQAARLAPGRHPHHPRPGDRVLDERHPRDLPGGRQARLLPEPRVPDRTPDAGRDLEPRPARTDARGAEAPRRRLRRDLRARGRRRPRQRRPRPARCLLHGEHGHRRRPRLRLRHPLPPRPLPPGDPRRQPGRASRDLARARQSLGVRPARGRLRHLLRRPGRVPRAERHHRALRLDPGREGQGHRLRHPDRRLARPPGEHPPPVEGGPDRPDPPRRLQRRRPHRQPRREQPRRRPDPRPLPRRHLARRAGAPPPAGVFLLVGLAPGHPAAPPAAVRPPRQSARQGCDPAQRHPPGRRRRGTDAAPHRRPRPRLRRGMAADAGNDRLHQPHPAARGAGDLAGAALRAAAAAPHADHLRDQRQPAQVRPPRTQAERRRGALDQPDRRVGRAAGAGWATSPSSARTRSTASRRCTRTCSR